MSITFTLNNGSTLTLGKESKNIRVVSQSEIQRNAKSVKTSFIVLEEVYGKRYYIEFDC